MRLARRNWGLYVLLAPAFILLILFTYVPMYGIVIAFKDYVPALGITGSPWADPWFRYFQQFAQSFQFVSTIRNTLVLSLYGMAVGFPIPIIMALFINQFRAKHFKNVFQTVVYMPHFISTVVLVGLIMIILSPSSGIFGNICRLIGVTAPNLMGSATAFSSIYVWSDVWQNTGWNSIIYLAALSAIDPNLYEAATVDGAGRWQKVLRIDVPMLMPTAVILLILQVGNIMNVGFEKVYLMQNNLNAMSSEIIATYVYKIGLLSAQFSYSAAINFFNTIINFILLILVNEISKKVSDTSLW